MTLDGASFRDQSLFADALSELLGPLANPRYLLTRRGRTLWRRRVDFHAVPRLLGTNKELAAALHKARMRALSAAFATRAERSDRWH